MAVFTDHLFDYIETFTISCLRDGGGYSQDVHDFGITDLKDGEAQFGLATVEGVKNYVKEKSPKVPTNLPVYILEWHSGIDSGGVQHPTEEEKQVNIDVIKEVQEIKDGAYLLYLKTGNGRLLPVGSMNGSGEYTFIDTSDSWGAFPIYTIRYTEIEYQGHISATYYQDKDTHVSPEFDDTSWAAPSMIAVADYVEKKLSEFSAIDSEVLL